MKFLRTRSRLPIPLPPLNVISNLRFNSYNDYCFQKLPSGKQMKPHQIHVIDYLRKSKRKGILLLHKVGTGKTLTSIISSRCLITDNQSIKKVIILVPSSVTEYWKNVIYTEIGNLKAPNSLLFCYSKIFIF